MERKIFNYQYESRIKVNFDDFKSCYWHLRSMFNLYVRFNFYTYDVGVIGAYGNIYHFTAHSNYDIAPVCMI